MGQTLLDMAKAQLRTYDIIMSVARDDESQVKSAAYHLQQSVELMLKHCIELSGVAYPKTHDIGQLLGVMDFSSIFSESTLTMLTMASGTVTEMESKTRYIKDYHLSLSIVLGIAALAQSALEDAERYSSTITGTWH